MGEKSRAEAGVMSETAAMTQEDFLEACAGLGVDVSRETSERLAAYDATFLDWASRINLVARSTIEDRWRRHYLDSAQIAPLILTSVRRPESPRRIVDIGSGAGFPGLVIAALLAEKNVHVTLIESTGKKAAFLAAAAEAMGLENVQVIPARIESVRLSETPDVITARALANLSKLLGYGAGLQGKNTKYVLLKGQDVGLELTEAAKSWQMEVVRHQSVTHPGGVILEIGNVSRVQASA
ncbi:MAG: 16S rRNA (guanine(527)-N(7))-methyltransferase RsmG [Pseudomonadota bacterium]